MAEDKITKTLQIIKNDKSLEDHFFKKLAVATKPIEWLVPLKDAGYFDPGKNPRPQEVPNKKGYYTVPYWNILDALENMAVKNEENPSDEVTNILAEIIDSIITYRENGERINNFRTDWKLLTTISHLPIQNIGSRHIAFIKDALLPSFGTSLLDHEIGSLFLPKLTKERAVSLIVELLDVILHYRKSDGKSSREYLSVMDQYYLKEILDKNKEGIADVCAIEAAKVAISKMRGILAEDKSQFNYIWIPAIEDHEQTHFPDRYEYQLVHFLRDMLEAANPKEADAIVKDMLNDEHDIFKRLAFHLINHYYEDLSHLLWDISYNPLDSLTMHEFYELFKAHCKKFDKEQIRKALEWIENQDLLMPEDIKNNPEKKASYEAYYKKEWLLALLDSDDPDVKRRYDEYNEINDATYDHPGFHYWFSGVHTVVDVSPITEEEVKNKTNEELAEYINLYKEEAGILGADHTRVNLASSVRKFVSNDPVRFSHNLTPFLAVSRKYQYELLRGLEEAWRNNRDFEWNELLLFMEQLLEDESFWSEEKKEGQDDYNTWITDIIASLIEEGTQNDKHAFSSDLLPVAERILILLLKNVRSDMRMISDLVTSVLNSSKGKCFMAMINFSLRYARLHKGGKEERWISSIKSDFTKRLDKSIEPDIEFSTVIGWYLPQLNYLDEKWVKDNVNRIFDVDSGKHWEAAFTSHIVMTSTVYEEIYKLIRDNGHYEKALFYSFKDKNASEKLVQTIVVGYLAGWDNLEEDGLINKLLASNNAGHLSNLVSFMWHFRDKEEKELRKKITPLWEKLIKKIEPNVDKEEYRKIASDLGRWLCFVDSIDDDIYEWLRISVKFIGENWNSSFFIEYLLVHVTKTPEKVGDLYLDMLNAGTYPEYKKEDIIAIVQALYDLKIRDTANRICNLYYSKGYEFLKETFEKNN